MYNVNSISGYFQNTGMGTYDYRKELAAKLESQKTINNNEVSNKKDSTGSISVELSSRAQKLQKLNEDFFPGGYQTIKITSDFIGRLQEYGFLSQEEAEQLTPKKEATTGQQESVDLNELSNFIGQFKDKLEKEDPDNGLIATLQKADHIINNFDTQTMKSDIKNVINDLKEYSSSEKAENLSAVEKDFLSKLEITLQVADKLTLERNASPKINEYLSVLNQFS